jgi:voltage-gated potassium channel
MSKRNKLQEQLYRIIFEADTKSGKAFDIVLLFLILLSIVLVMLESINEVRNQAGNILHILEWAITLLFTVEYLLRIYSSPKPHAYIFSFMGIIDLLAILPTYLAFGIDGAHALIIIRAFRLLRVFRIFKLYHVMRAGHLLLLAVRNSALKIFIFMLFVVILVILLGSFMYVIEGGKNGFYSIPISIYWAVITITTVGYGDIVPVTALGKFVASFIMLLGYSIIAIPTGIMSVEMARTFREQDNNHEKIKCPNCNAPIGTLHANFCPSCGEKLNGMI